MNITGGIYKGRKIIAPDENIVRPTLSKIRESVFSCLFSLIGDFEKKSFLDMFAGSGIMGLEAVSRGFSSVLAIEKHPKVAQVLKKNYITLGENPNVIIGNSLKILQKINNAFDVIYLDPPYDSGIYEEALKKIKESRLLKENTLVILEHTSDVNWQEQGFTLVKQKKYANKFITFLNA